MLSCQRVYIGNTRGMALGRFAVTGARAITMDWFKGNLAGKPHD